MRLLRCLAFLALGLLHGSCLPVVEGRDLDLAGQQVRLTILHTSDLHSRLLPYDFRPLRTDVDLGLIPEAGPFGGVARMASIIKRERKRSDRVLHLDSGDSFQGAPIFNLNLGEVEYRFLSLIGLDAAVIGNHEFDAGAFNFTRQAKEAAKFPVLVANYEWEDYRNPVANGPSNTTALYTQPYTIRNVGGLRVGVIGLGNIGSLNSIVEQGNSLQAIPLEQNEVVRNYVEFLRPAVDLVMITSHAGLTEDQDLIEGYEAFYEWGIAKKYVHRGAWPWALLEVFGETDANGEPVADSEIVRVQIPGVEGIDAIVGGHLHIVLNPPQLLRDPAGRRVILSHGGAFSKYVNRLDFVIQMPQRLADPTEGGEILSHDFKVFPIDSVWCSEGLHQLYRDQFWDTGAFIRDPRVLAGIEECKAQEDKDTAQLLQSYITDLDARIALTTLFAFAPTDIARRNNSTGGDSPLGNMTADSMRKRRGIEAEVAITNSLGIRDNLYAGPVSIESMFNVFPFENTINVMFLSGREMQELFDFITERSTGRGCVSQAQVSGARFTMDCAQAQLNQLRLPCDPNGDASECPNDGRTGGRAPWQCLADPQTNSGRCWSSPATNLTINGAPLQVNESYRIAVNDYIARGGSGFLVLKRNTTRVESGIPLRDSLIGFMQNFCTCDDLLASKTDTFGNLIGANQQPCGTRSPDEPSRWEVNPVQLSFCQQAKTFSERLLLDTGGGCSCLAAFRGDNEACVSAKDVAAQCQRDLPAGPFTGKCNCRDALAGDPICGTVTRAVQNFCENPTRIPIATGEEDGRIARRVK
jgi:2',3'-cyclic-nucleotide 2'-phosphodiesterase (5'-nucleotidase family)